MHVIKTTNNLKPRILYRDDDVNVYTNAFEFKRLHEKFIKDRITHSVALIMKDLWENHALFWYLATAPYLNIGLHGWEHRDYSKLSFKDCYEDLNKALYYWEENSIRMVGSAKPIHIFFAPWNKRGDGIIKACNELRLKFCDIRKGQWEGLEVRSFHHWNIIDNEFTYEKNITRA